MSGAVIALDAGESALVLTPEGIRVIAANDEDRRVLLAIAALLEDPTWRDELLAGSVSVP